MVNKIILVALAIMLCSSAFCAGIDDVKEMAKGGSELSQSLLGLSYFHGHDVPQNYKEAVKWFRKAAEQGNSLALFMLGLAYRDGKGVPQNYKEAYFWLNLAASQDSSVARQRDEVAAKLTPGKLEEVQARCTKWLEDFEKRKRESLK
ncbi:MAG: hypothetical protein CVV42_05650 [Candidatus Riflebacteria bacterium HGW-Riflebacteria-2]|jgi:hypothetical protein|nr:MAG: hypothetical protein CVV42_05650 [Candidatus Riflebacteria bacterium HGW-Riflebacteria-2]